MHLTIRERVARALDIDLQGKADVYVEVYSSANIASLSFWAEVALSAGIATLGLVQNSPAVIIGAMLISPLMGTILSTGLALAVGDSYLLLKSFLNLMLSMVASIGLAGLLVWLLPFHSVTPEILARIHPNLLDLGIAILSGLAGSIVVCRGRSGSGVMALPGVAIAVALMPPLCVVGFGLGNSLNMEIMYGASLLFLTNLVAIVCSAFAVFLLVGMDEPALRSRIGESEVTRAEHEWLYRMLQKSSLRKLMYLRGGLQWRMLTLLVLLAIVFIPLREGLIQVKNEVIARGAVLDAIHDLVPSGSVVAQNVQYAPDRVGISIVSAVPIEEQAIEKARRLIERRTGSQANIAVQEVASRRELTEVLDRLNAPLPQSAPKPQSMASLEGSVVGLMGPAMNEIWPPATTLRSWELGFSPDGPVLHLQYQGKAVLDPFAISLLEQALRSKLDLPTLIVTAEVVQPEPQSRKSNPAK